jgi:riboflavin kinase/FMN adenylyltransferase
VTDPAPRLVTLDSVPAAWRQAVVAIGNFDGVHRGHQTVLAAARAQADHIGTRAIILTLEPHPRAFFSGRTLFRLTPAPLKAAAAAGYDMDGTVVLPFDRALADLSAHDFVRQILIDRLGIRHAVTGFDFQFGHKRQGTPDLLHDEGAVNGFGVTVCGALSDRDGPISSTRIRAALARGEVATANELLGWSWSVEGRVVGGERRGRELGYPTANMALDPATELAHGIYAVRFVRRDGSVHGGVASFGRRPTFDNGKPLLETFVFDFTGDLYGETALVSLVAHIRPELRFDTVEHLVARMEQDSLEARAILERTPVTEIDRRIHAEWAALG